MTVRVNKSSFNIREKLSELERPIGLKGSELMRAETAQDARDLVSAGRKNLIFNGGFAVSQRGDVTSSAVTAGHDSYWIDRWMSLKNGTTSTVQRVTRTIDGVSKYAARIECTVATTGITGIFGFAQRIEALNIKVPKIYTVSCWARTNHPYVGFRTNTFGNTNGGDFGSKFPSDGNWHRVSAQVDSTGLTSDHGDILIVAYNNASVSIAVGQYIEIADVQVEEGTLATEFEHRSYGEELALCQRYFQRIGKQGHAGVGKNDFLASGFVDSNGTAFYGGANLKVSMRSSPTISINGTASHLGYTHPSVAFVATGLNNYWSNPESYVINLGGTGSGTTGFGAYARISNNETQLDFNAEL